MIKFLPSNRLLEEVGQVMIQRDHLLRKLEKQAIFQRYLDRVLEVAEEFHEIRDVISRYDTLTSTHEVRVVSLLTFFASGQVTVSQSLQLLF